MTVNYPRLKEFLEIRGLPYNNDADSVDYQVLEEALELLRQSDFYKRDMDKTSSGKTDAKDFNLILGIILKEIENRPSRKQLSLEIDNILNELKDKVGRKAIIDIDKYLEEVLPLKVDKSDFRSYIDLPMQIRDLRQKVFDINLVQDKINHMGVCIQDLSCGVSNNNLEIEHIRALHSELLANTKNLDEVYPSLIVTKVITSTQVKALNGTPIDLIDDVSTDYAYKVLEIDWGLDWNSAAYTSLSGKQLSVQYETSGEIDQLDTTGFLDQTSGQTRHTIPHTSNNKGLLGFNEKIVLTMNTGEVLTGDSDITLKIRALKKDKVF